jgi:RimJ/RimL family protein N-acetyltransferase
MENADIREAVLDDAAELLDFIRQVTGETPFLRFFPEEVTLNVEQERDFIRKFSAGNTSRLLVARIGGKVAATASIEGTPLKKFRHRGELGIAVLQCHWGKGLGTRLMQELLDWARANPLLSKLILHVNVENHAAVHLYLKCGFRREGLLSRDFYYDGRYVDTLIMGIDV